MSSKKTKLVKEKVKESKELVKEPENAKKVKKAKEIAQESSDDESVEVPQISIQEATDIALGKRRADFTQKQWRALFIQNFPRYLDKHPKSKILTDDWEANYKTITIYERKIMDAVTLIVPELKRKDTLTEFKKQYGISDVNWNQIIQLHEWAIFEFKEYLNWTEVSKRPFDEDFIPYIADFIDWRMFSRGYVSENIIRKYHRKLDWAALCKQGVSENIIREFPDNVHWKLLPEQHYSEEFVIDFYSQLKNMNYTPTDKSFFKKVGWKNVNWNTIRTDNLSNELIMKKAAKINWVLNRDDLSRRAWPEEFIDEHASKFFWDELPVSHIGTGKFIKKYKDHINWKALSHELRNEKFIDVFHAYVVWEHLPSKEFSDEFVIKHQKDLYWANVLVDHLKEETLEACAKYLIWSRVSRRVSEDFIRKYQNKVDWGVIANRKDLSKKFRTEFAKKLQPFLRDHNRAINDTEQEFTKELLNPEKQKFLGNYR